jgi:dihydroorotate dehydrogenase
MPDWTYQTILGPAVFSAASQRRPRVLRLLDRLGRSRFAAPLVELVGHMAPPTVLEVSKDGFDLATPIGLGADLPGNDQLLSLVSRFGVGFVEVGPVALRAEPALGASELVRSQRALLVPTRPAQIGIEELHAALQRPRSHSAPLVVRLGLARGSDAAEATLERVDLVRRLAPHALFFTLPLPDGLGEPSWTTQETLEHVSTVVEVAQMLGKKLLVLVDHRDQRAFAQDTGADGIWIRGRLADEAGQSVLGGPQAALVLSQVRQARIAWPAALIVAGGVLEPKDAVQALAAGAHLVAVDAGLVVSGPGLPKRCNEALWSKKPATPPPRLDLHGLASAWTAFALLAGALIMSGVLAGLVALDRVVLPYDEAHLGASRAELEGISGRLLPFLSHDRIALSGTTIAIGTLYLGLCWQGFQQGARWARTAIVSSALPGFASFLLYSWFGYFDVLDARGTLLMFCLFLLGLVLPLTAARAPRVADLRDDAAWRRSLWGQAGFVGLGIGFISAGLTIAIIGSSSVFVDSDLAFLRLSPATLDSANGRLLSVIAHDRARFGGALVSVGVAIALTAMWGIRRGARATWWSLACAGVPGFVAGIGVHAAIGYVDAMHLALPIVALLVYVVSLALLYPYLCGRASDAA